MPYKGGKRKKRRTHATGPAVNVPQEEIPKSIVAKTSGVSPRVADLALELRSIMRPYTATNLKERKYNRPKDYLQVAGLLGVTHVGIVSQTESNTIYKIARAPQGPTLHFKVLQYSLMKHVRALQKHPFESPVAYQTPPLVVLNNFGQATASHIALMRATLQNMYPSLNLQKVKLSECRRVVLYHYNKEEDVVEQRHFAIRAAPVGVSRNIKKLVQAKLPNLGNLQDVSEFVDGTSGANAAAYSDSEAEDDTTHVVLPESYMGRGNVQSQKSAVKLVELGPRLTLELFKVERGFHEGDVLYHKYVHKTPEEAAELKVRKETEREEKKRRREEQEENVQRKKTVLEEKMQKKAEKRAQRQVDRDERSVKLADDEQEDGDDERSVGSDDDDDEAGYAHEDEVDDEL